MSRLNEDTLGQLVSAVFDGNETAGIEVLAPRGFLDPRAAFIGLSRILRPLDPGPRAEGLASLLLDTIPDCADPDMALGNWERLFEAAFSRATLASVLIEDPHRVEFLSRLFGHSQFLADWLVLNPEYVDWLDSPATHRDKSLATYEEEMARAVSLVHGPDARRDALCRYHRRELLRIGLRDVMGWASLATVTAELSDLATATIRAALAICDQTLRERHGTPLRGQGASASGLAVIAMGKLGGRELNYSSDVDLVFVFEAMGETSGVEDATGQRTRVISNQEYFAKLGARLIDFLSRHGPEGYLYRVDMRLRPDGESGPLVPSMDACTNYYLGRARVWERIALLKARGVAGDPGLIDHFQRMAEGFVYAAARPAVLLTEVERLKARIDREIEKSELADREIKRGRGGLREIEFIVAALQILHGESRPGLRVRSTLEAIARLRDEAILLPEDAHLLEAGYRFYRAVEHALQCMAWRQTHVLPADENERAALAVRCGLRGTTRRESAALFEAQRHRFATPIHALFEEMFRADAEKRQPDGESPLRLLESRCSPEEAAALLERWRIHDPGVVTPLRRLARGSAGLFVSAEGQRRFEQILPAVLDSCRRTPWPAKAVRHLEGFIQACNNAAGYYQLLAENRPVLDLLIRLFGTSELLSQRLIRNPGWFEALVQPETFAARPDELREAGRDLVGRTDPAPDRRLRALREFAFLNSLRIGLRYIVELASSRETAAMLSALADACVDAAAAWAIEDVLSKEGIAPETDVPFAILALGKLGRRELIFRSDLDVVFVADTNGAWTARHTDDAVSLFTRIAERFIHYLKDPAAGGAAFDVDARLRPEGRNSPLVTTLEGFRRHFDRRPEVWEIQTYLGARPVAGNRALGEQALDVVVGTIDRLGDKATVAESVRTMRRRLEESVRLPRWASADFKRGAGGLVDLEFIAQYLQILHGAQDRGRAMLPPRDVFTQAGETDWLDRATAERLVEDYDFLRRLELDVRLVFESRETCFPSAADRAEALAHAPGREQTASQALREQFEQRTQRVREAFRHILEGNPET